VSDPKGKDAKYNGQYEAWDYWLYQNARDTNSEEFSKLYTDGELAGWTWLYGGVDKQGNLVPYLLSSDEDLAARNGVGSTAGSSGCAFRIIAGGPMDEALRQRFIEARSAIYAKYAAEVPKWLASEPPTYAILLPDGRVAALGEPGAGKDSAELAIFGRPQAEDTHWHLYDATGALMAQGEPGGEWWHLTFTNFRQELGLDKGSVQAWEYNGIISAYTAGNYTSSSVYTYDGQRLDEASAARMYTAKPGQLDGYYGAELPCMYKAQRKLKK